MSKNKTYKSDALAAIHETVSDLFNIGLIDKTTKRHFDEACLTSIENFTGDDIRALREREQVSQDVFARYLNVTKGMVSKWECGKKQPTGTSKKLLSLVKKKGLAAIA
jgi:putative transcriptional regulator